MKYIFYLTFISSILQTSCSSSERNLDEVDSIASQALHEARICQRELDDVKSKIDELEDRINR